MEEKLPLDARLLSDAIIELNISRHNVSIYPKDHPLVNKSLNRAFDFLNKLFELRNEITIAVAKDTIIIDEHSLDKKNPVYKDLALHLSRMNIAYVTFRKGLTRDELYSFHRFILGDVEERPSDNLKEKLEGYNLAHIKVGFIDYGLFSYHDGETEGRTSKKRLWEWYVHGLLEGTLQSPDELHEIPPHIFARLLNEAKTDNIKDETYDRVIATYLRESSERAFSSKEFKRLLDFINGLRPELKKQFLSSSVRTFLKDIDSIHNALRGTPVEKVIELLNNINEQKVAIPESLMNLLDKFSRLDPDGLEKLTSGGGVIADDIYLSPETISLLDESGSETFVSPTYHKELQAVFDSDISGVNVEEATKLQEEWSDEYIEKDFNQTILELMSSGLVPQEEFEYFNNLLKEQIEEFIGTGRYGQAIETLRLLGTNVTKREHPYKSMDILLIPLIIDSFRVVGKQNREDAMLLCEFFGEEIIPHLMDTLIEEDSLTVRKFLLDMIIRFGDKAAPEAIKHLKDSRWYVKRNMLFILGEIESRDAVSYVMPYCHHENPKVSFQAIKYLLKIKDHNGIEALKKCLKSGSKDIVEQAMIISGTFKVRDVVPDLINMLSKKVLTGADFYNKIPVVRTLGQIGDPSALYSLRGILSSRSLLFKGPLRKLKEEIYSTLKNYPSEDVKDLIK